MSSTLTKSSEESKNVSNGISDQGYEFTKPVTFHLGFHVPGIWDDDDLAEVFYKWRSVCKPHRHNFKVLPRQERGFGHPALVRMIFTGPAKAFAVLKEVRIRSIFYHEKEAEMKFCGIWVFVKGAGGPMKLLPDASRNAYSWTEADTLKFQHLISWYTGTSTKWRHPTKADFPFFGDFLHDFDDFGQGSLAALPEFSERNLKARTDP